MCGFGTPLNGFFGKKPHDALAPQPKPTQQTPIGFFVFELGVFPQNHAEKPWWCMMFY